jgi:ABC-type amino acid transport system permease subunit
MNSTLLPIRLVFVALCAGAGWLTSATILAGEHYRAVAIVVGLAIGTLVSGAMLSRHRALAWAGRTFVSFFRGAPLLVLDCSFDFVLIVDLFLAALTSSSSWIYFSQL